MVHSLRRVSLLATLPGLLVLGSLSACSDSSVVGGQRTPTNSCRRNEDCAEGVCDLAQSRCLVSAQTSVFFSVTPSPTALRADSFPTYTQPRTIQGGDHVDLALSAARTVYGSVTLSNDTNTSAGVTEQRTYVPAAVEFVPEGLDDVVRPTRAVAVDNGAMVNTTDRRPYTFQTLLPDGAFDVVVRPVSELAGRLPPLFQPAVDLRTDTVQQRFDIAYPARFARWSGVIRDRMGNPFRGLVVRAVDLAHNARVVSTVVTTAGPATGTDSPAEGSFNLDFAPGAPSDWTLRITSDTSTASWLTIDIPHATLERSDPTGRDIRIELPSDLGLPYIAGMRPSGGLVPSGVTPPACVGCVDVRGAVAGRSARGGTRYVRDAEVSFRVPIPMAVLGQDVDARFECRTTSDADGNFRAWLVPGEYTVDVVPSSGEFGNTHVARFPVAGDVPQQLGRQLDMAARISTEGRILTPSRMAVAGARVTAVPFHRAYATHPCFANEAARRLAERATTRDTLAGSDGSYRLDLDPGLYRLLVEPSTGIGFPTTLSSTICVDEGRVTAFDVTLDTPLEVHGVVRDSSERPAAGATVEAIIRVREPNAPGAVVRVARVSTDASGAYSLLLPSGAAVTP